MSTRPRSSRPILRPRATLGILYAMVFFFIYCLALAAPALIEILNSIPPGEEQQEQAYEAARVALQGRVGVAVIATLITIAGAGYANILPGLRRDT